MKNDQNDVRELAENAGNPDAICRRNAERCDPDPPVDHRRHRRMQSEGPIVSVKYSGGKEMQAHVLDVSSEGLCIQLEHGPDLQPNQVVYVRLAGADWVLSMVAHVDARHVGLWFGEPVSKEAGILLNEIAGLIR